MTGKCSYCGGAYTGEPEEIHQCIDGGVAMRAAHEKPFMICGKPLDVVSQGRTGHVMVLCTKDPDHSGDCGDYEGTVS